jgi:hypothetical protein
MPGGAMICTPGGMARRFDLDLAIGELSFAQHLAEFLARLRITRLGSGIGGEAHHLGLRQQRVEDALLGGIRARSRTLAFSSSRAIFTATSASP